MASAVIQTGMSNRAQAKAHVTTLQEHVRNLEDEREHLRLDNAHLKEANEAVREGRVPLRELLVRWTRGRLRRTALGRWWIARKVAPPA